MNAKRLRARAVEDGWKNAISLDILRTLANDDGMKETIPYQPTSTHTNSATLSASLTNVPPLLNAAGIALHIAPLGKTLLYELATAGEIQSASLGIGRGKRVFVTSSVIAWIERRMSETKIPRLATRRRGQASEATISEN